MNELNDARELVRLITEKTGNSRTFISGVVMIAPIYLRSFKVDDIVTATGFRRSSVERAALNLWRYGIWTNDEGWCCEWGKMFSDEFDAISEEEMFQLQICFILDVLVAEGLVERQRASRKEFTYKSLEPVK